MCNSLIKYKFKMNKRFEKLLGMMELENYNPNF